METFLGIFVVSLIIIVGASLLDGKSDAFTPDGCGIAVVVAICIAIIGCAFSCGD